MVMEQLMAHFPLPLFVLLVGCLGAPLIGLLGKRLKLKWASEVWMFLVASSALASIYLLYLQVQATTGGVLVFSFWGQPPPLGGCFEVDALGVFMAFSIAFLGFLVSLYSINYMESEGRRTEFYSLLTLMMAGLMGVALAGDFLTLFIFWELMSISSYVLVAFHKGTWGPIEAGFKYLVMSATAGAFLLLSMSIIYGLSGTLNFAGIALAFKGTSFTIWPRFLFTTLIIGFGVKSAIVPLHTWLPDAHPEAPSPVSALLSGLVIETALYALTRILYLIFDPLVFQLPIAILAAVTMTLANVTALYQTDVKRMFAYSSIAQIGYMMVGLAAGTAYGLMGLFLQIFNHSLTKGLAFLSTGSIIHETNTREINRLKGIGRMMPITSLALFVAVLGLGGVPATSGFISKFILFNSAFYVGLGWLAVVGLLNSALSMGYYLRVVRNLFSKSTDNVVVHEPGLLMVGVILTMAVLIVLFGLWPSPLIDFATSAANSLVLNITHYISAVFG
jgi:multicomponent Na+:H+ antiporter subunit D